MRNAESLGPEAIGAFLEASQGIEFAGQSQEEIYGWVHATLLQEEYFRQGKKGRGAIRTYMQKVTGRSRAQITRLIGLYRKTGELKSRAGRRHRFARKYTAADILLLAVVDRAHERLSGPATRHVLEREYKVYGKREFARLAEISVSHLYNLRATAAYRRRAAVFVPTRPRPSRSESDADPIRGENPATCGWTAFTKEIRTESRGSSISTQWTR